MSAIRNQNGLAFSSVSRAAVEAYDRAATLFHGYYADPMAAVDAALAADPGFAMARILRAGMLITTTERTYDTMIADDLAAAGTARLDDRERRHLLAIRRWAAGDMRGAADVFGRIVIDHPQDVVALQMAHLGDFLLGQASMLRDRPTHARHGFAPSALGYGFVLGMQAFGLEECGQYEAAEEAGRAALACNPRDPWAVHAVAHVMEMQGRYREGQDWLRGGAQDWAPENGFAYHNWWHLALFHLEENGEAAALEVYDTRVRPAPTPVLLEMIDATALLWRLLLRGVDVGHRFDELADKWTAVADDGVLAFNDVHGLLAQIGSGRMAAAEDAMAALERSAGGRGSNAGMAAEVGVPLGRALLAFGKAQYADSVNGLLAVRPIAQRLGGSHAQRDILSLTLLEAARRAGDRAVAAAVLAERVAAKPDSPFVRRLLGASGQPPIR